MYGFLMDLLEDKNEHVYGKVRGVDLTLTIVCKATHILHLLIS